MSLPLSATSPTSFCDDDRLWCLQDNHYQPIQLASPDWFRWLNHSANTLFYFRSAAGCFVARRQGYGHDAYWYAYHHTDHHFRGAYLGKAEDLIQERLDSVAAQLDRASPRHRRSVAVDRSSPFRAARQGQIHEDVRHGIGYVERPLAGLARYAGTAAPSPAVDRPAPDVAPLLEPVRTREIEILRLVAAGYSNQAIAEQLVISVGTVRWHLKNIYGKLDVHSRTGAVARARALRLLD